MSAGLKQELGLEDPKPGETSAQKDEFKQKFLAVINPINANLQYTSAHAHQSKHDAHASKKEVSYQAYQAALGKINPKDPAVAKGDIDKVMIAIGNVGKVIEEFKQGAEKSFNAWTSRQPEVEKQSDKIREMQEWGHAKAVALNGVADAIKGKANERSYEEANSAIDQMLEKMKPIVDDYEKQKVAQKEYEPAFQALQPRLEGTRACGFKGLLQQKQELSTGTEQMKTAATAKDYVSGLTQLKTLETSVAAFETRKAEIEAKKKEYEAALPNVKSAEADGKTVYKKLTADKDKYAALKVEMEKCATEEDYEGASSKCTELTTQVNAYITAVDTLEAKKKEYEAALEPLKSKLDEAAKRQHPDAASLPTLRTQMEKSAQDGEYEQALKSQEELKAKVENILAAPKEAGGGGGAGPDGKPAAGQPSATGPDGKPTEERKLEKLDRDPSGSSPKDGGTPTAPAGNLPASPSETKKDAKSDAPTGTAGGTSKAKGGGAPSHYEPHEPPEPKQPQFPPHVDVDEHSGAGTLSFDSKGNPILGGVIDGSPFGGLPPTKTSPTKHIKKDEPLPCLPEPAAPTSPPIPPWKPPKTWGPDPEPPRAEGPFAPKVPPPQNPYNQPPKNPLHLDPPDATPPGTPPPALPADPYQFGPPPPPGPPAVGPF